MVQKQGKNSILGIDVEATCKKIGKYIEKSGMTDRVLGNKMGISVQAVNKWRHGYVIPDIENLYILSRIIGVKVDDFLVSKEEKVPEYIYSTYNNRDILIRLVKYMSVHKKNIENGYTF